MRRLIAAHLLFSYVDSGQNSKPSRLGFPKTLATPGPAFPQVQRTGLNRPTLSDDGAEVTRVNIIAWYDRGGDTADRKAVETGCRHGCKAGGAVCKLNQFTFQRERAAKGLMT